MWRRKELAKWEYGIARPADSASLTLKSSRANNGKNIAAGSVMIGVGIFLMAKA